MISLKSEWQGLRTLSLSLSEGSILNKVKEGYLVLLSIIPHISKSARFTIGARIENKFLDLLELTYTAYFSEKERKSEKISECIFVLDIIKFLILISWESKIMSSRHYEHISVELDEVGKMLWGWKNSLKTAQKKNPAQDS